MVWLIILELSENFIWASSARLSTKQMHKQQMHYITQMHKNTNT